MSPADERAMGTPDSNTRALAQSLLKREAGDSPDTTRLAQATVRILQKLRRRFAPLLGSTGFGAMLGRALRQTRRELPFLTGVEPAWGNEVEMRGLLDTIEALDHVQAEAAALDILSNLLGVLTEIIGWDLTDRAVKDDEARDR